LLELIGDFDLTGFAESPVREGGSASAGSAEDVKMPHGLPRGASRKMTVDV